MRNLLAALLVLTMLYSCHRDKLRALHFESVGGLVVADSSDWKGKVMAYDTNRPWGLYPIYYIGPKTDTVGLGRKPVQGMWVNDWRDTCMHCAYLFTDSTIRVTAYPFAKTTHTIVYQQYRSHDWPAKRIDSVIAYSANLIAIENTSKSIIFIGESHLLLAAVLQAKDSTGNWKNIESSLVPSCGTGLRSNYLEPGEILIAKMVQHTGNYQATCRLKLERLKNTVYSNTFEYLIDKRQLTDSLQVTYY